MAKKSLKNEMKQFKYLAKRLIDKRLKGQPGTKRTLFRVKEGKGLA